MWRALAVAGITAALVAACHRTPAPTLEYGETVTYTSTADDPAPEAVAPARAGSGAALPQPAAAASEPQPASAADSDSGAVVPESDGGAWSTTVPTGAASSGEVVPPGGATAPVEAAAPQPSEPAAAEPSEPAAPPARRQWYGAKPW